MLELLAVKNSMWDNNMSKDDWDKLSDEEKRNRTISMTVSLLIYLAIWIWALMRAVRCGKGQTKVMHVFFASVSPVIYLLFSYFSKDFCT